MLQPFANEKEVYAHQLTLPTAVCTTVKYTVVQISNFEPKYSFHHTEDHAVLIPDFEPKYSFLATENQTV